MSKDLPSWWWLARIVAAVAVRPRLWGVAAITALRLAQPRWWRHWPPLPRPPAAYVRFRAQTAYGDQARAPDPADVVAYLHWCRNFGRLN